MLNEKALGLSAGILSALFTLVFTFVSSSTGYGQLWLTLMGTLYPLYDASFFGAVVGAIYAFIAWFAGFYMIAWLYNRFT